MILLLINSLINVALFVYIFEYCNSINKFEMLRYKIIFWNIASSIKIQWITSPETGSQNLQGVEDVRKVLILTPQSKWRYYTLEKFLIQFNFFFKAIPPQKVRTIFQKFVQSPDSGLVVQWILMLDAKI